MSISAICVGESALSTGRIEVSWCTALSATSPRPENDSGTTLIYYVRCRVNGDTAQPAHTVCLPDVLRRCGTPRRFGKLFFRIFAGADFFLRESENKKRSVTYNSPYAGSCVTTPGLCIGKLAWKAFHTT